MQFYSYPTVAKESGIKQKDWCACYERLIPQTYRTIHNRRDFIETLRYPLEMDWLQHGMQYYKLFPAIIPHMLSLDLSKVYTTNLPTIKPVTLLMPVGNKLGIESILVSTTMYEGEKYLIACIATNMRMDDGTVQVISLHHNDPTNPISSLKDGDEFGAGEEIGKLVMDAAHLAVCSILLSRDSADSIITPDVLTKDLTKYRETLDPKYIEKAKRRGKNGFTVGAEFQVVPHTRKAHLALYWTGPGRKVPVIKWRGLDKPIIVHRKVVETVPTEKEHA